jgi:hypothetical protein
MSRRVIVVAVAAAYAVIMVSTQIQAYPGGTPQFVTNNTPLCAGCHSSTSPDQLRNMAADAAGGLLIDKHHYDQITNGERAYGKLSTDDRTKLLTAVKAMDANSHAELTVSAAKVKPLGTLTATVKTRGGAGPVVGVMLLDTDLRNQSSPIQTEGFYITDAPKVTGPDGKPQTKFLEGRAAGLAKNINYVNITDVKSDPDANTYADCQVTYSLRAPSEPGTYTMTAAFLFGTEKATAVGRTETPDGRVMPVGGMSAGAGRILFAKPVTVTVAK